jgi:hypothetical protein
MSLSAIISPHHTFFLGLDTEGSRRRAASLTAALLFFDTLAIATVAWPYEGNLIAEPEIHSKTNKIIADYGVEVFSDYEKFADRLSAEDIIFIMFQDYILRWEAFRKQAEPLFTHGVLCRASIQEYVEQIEQTPEAAAKWPANTPYNAYNFLMQLHFPEVLRNWEQFISRPENRDTFSQSYRCSRDQGLACMHLYRMIRDRSPWVTEARDPRNHSRLLHMAHGMDMFAQLLVSLYSNTPIITDDESHLELASRVPALEAIQSIRKTDVAGKVETKLLTHTILSELPGILPKSFEAILELRHALSDDLQYFRQVLQSISRDIVESKREQVSVQDIEARARKELSEPLKALERQLSHPTRSLAKNIVGSGPVVSMGTTLVATAFLGTPLPGAALLGLGVGTAAACVKTRIEEAEIIDNSKVGFLLKAKRLVDARSRDFTLI